MANAVDPREWLDSPDKRLPANSHVPADSRFRRIALIHDDIPPGAPPDAQDALVQRDAIARVLAAVSYRTVAAFPVDLDFDRLRRQLLAFRPDAVFNLSEAPGGKDRLIVFVPALLETLGLPHTGASANALFLAADKSLAKRLLSRHGVRTPGWFDEDSPKSGVLNPLYPHPFGRGGRVIVKSRWDHASAGLDDDSVWTLPGEEPPPAPGIRALLLRRLAEFREKHGSPALIEQYVEGREFNLSFLEHSHGLQCLPPAEMRFEGFGDRPRILGYSAKWNENSPEYRGTARTFDIPGEDRPLLDKMRRAAADAWEAFGLRGCARMDFRVDAAGDPWLLEVNPNPCLSPDAGFAAAAARAGLDYAGMVERLLANASA